MSGNQTVNQSVIENHPADALTGLLFVLVGPAGVGKNSTMSPLVANVPGLRRLPTATTREQRPGELEGRDHFFVTRERFEEMIERKELLEHEEVHPGKFYGVPRELTRHLLAGGAYLLADIDFLGARALKAAFPGQVITIFIAPPNLETLEARLRMRGNMPEQEIQDRLRRARSELDHADEADYRVINEDLDKCVAEVRAIIQAEIAKRAAPGLQ